MKKYTLRLVFLVFVNLVYSFDSENSSQLQLANFSDAKTREDINVQDYASKSPEKLMNYYISKALSKNKENNHNEGLKLLLMANLNTKSEAAKAHYFLGKQYYEMSKLPQFASQSSQYKKLAKQSLKKAAELESVMSKYPENLQWGGAARRLLKTINDEMVLPTKGLVKSLYGMRSHPVSGAWKMHSGIDIAEYGNPPVKAMADGVVVRAGWISGYGNSIEIQYDNGYTSFYAHLRDFKGGMGTTSQGMKVKLGQIVGHMGHTGIGNGGDHLHLEMDHEGKPIDPANVLSKIVGRKVTTGTEL